ncbi:uncharacterized protein [Amphiura filiformis]|uniref:uncharacterized protein n=1 Tax=Amphiura filiformis TaxID=82378 RepID=UPI003B21C57A
MLESLDILDDSFAFMANMDDVITSSPKPTSNQGIPSEYNVSRKDRNIHGGGVFVAVTKRYVSTTEYSLDTQSEIVWCKIEIAGTKPLHIGSFYRPTDNKAEPIQQLNISLSKITQNGTLPNVILGGDFNCPDVEWITNTIKPNPQYGYKVNRALLDTVEEHGLIQQVKEPTRLNNILDLLLTTNPDLVEQVDVCPGMSDHRIVIAVINVKAKRITKPPRKVFVYTKMNKEGFKNDALAFQKVILTSNERSTSENWSHFTNEIGGMVEKHVPQKNIRERWDVPWLSPEIKRLIRKKQRVYNAFKKYKSDVLWEHFRKIRKTVHREMTKSKNDYNCWEKILVTRQNNPA